MPELDKRTAYLATFSNMATLAGLLGTIIGLIEAFTAVSNADLADKAELLSASISVGMNCTAFGLGRDSAGARALVLQSKTARSSWASRWRP